MSQQTPTSRFSMDIDSPADSAPTSPSSPSPRSPSSKKTMASLVASVSKTKNTSSRPKQSTEPNLNTPLADVSNPLTKPLEPISNPSHAPLPPAKPTNAKMQSIVFRLASKFRLPPVSTVKNPNLFRPPPMSETITAQGRREAALRERGLLPQKDLSEQERERDLLMLDPEPTSPEHDQPQIHSAADAIKREWEEKNSTSTPSKVTRASPPPPLNLSFIDPCQVPLPPSPVLPGTTQPFPTFGPLVDGVPLDVACLVSLPPSPEGSIRSIRSSTSLQSATRSAQVATPSTALSSATIMPLNSIILSRENEHPPLSPLSAMESESIMAASIATPSLTADSVTRTISSSTSEASVAEPVTVPVSNDLKIQTSLPPAVPIIVESPVEGGVLASVPEDEAAEPTSAKTEGDVAKPTPTRTPARRATESAATSPRKGGRKLSIRNIHRSVVGSLSSKPKPKNSGFDASNLPPSPSRKTSFTPPVPVRSLTINPTGVALRTPVSPSMHTRGTILMETTQIEDDESRRLSEMAFLM